MVDSVQAQSVAANVRNVRLILIPLYDDIVSKDPNPLSLVTVYKRFIDLPVVDYIYDPNLNLNLNPVAVCTRTVQYPYFFHTLIYTHSVL